MNTNRSSLSTGLPAGAEDDAEVVRILDGYLSGIEAGQPADPEKLLADHPALASQLRAYLEMMQLAGRVAEDPHARPEPAGSGLLTTLNFGSNSPPHIHLLELSDEHEPLVMPQSAEMPHSGVMSVGRYQLQGEIARGGMGAILRGRDVDLGRELAIKVLLESHQGDPQVIRRFVEEAQIGGQLQHPGVVPVYELGTFPDRRPYFAMKLVKGRTLAALLHERTGPTEDLSRFLGIFEQVCQTMAYAHARGVIHRDLKPSNVMVGSFGEVQVMDWGLAKVLHQGGIADETAAKPVDESVITTVRSGSAGSGSESQAGSVLGTPAYMAPEQARGEVQRVDERADVFGLGAILCEILTGRPPYSGSTRGEIRAQAARGDLTEAMSKLDASGTEIVLVALAKGCLASEVERRPRNAGAVAERVTSHLAGVQERLRSAELARVEAQARSEEEAKRRALSDELAQEAQARAEEAQVRARIERSRRRRSVALAASVLATFGLAGGGWAYLSREHAARRAATTRVVSDVLADAERLRGQARSAAPVDLTIWSDAVSAASHARDLLAQGEPDHALEQRVDATLSSVEQERAGAVARVSDIELDRRLLAELEAIRGNRSEHWNRMETDKEYAVAFSTFGIDLDHLDPKEAGGQIARRSRPVELASFLDDWALQRRIALGKKNEGSWQRLLEAAKAADPDPWRATLRDQIGRNDPELLRRLAGNEAALEGQAAPNLVLLARALIESESREPAERVLRRAWRIAPDDFWVNFLLAAVYYPTDSSHGRAAEAVRYLSAAVAIRPRSVAAHVNLGEALKDQRRLAEAIAEYREALRLRPASASVHSALGGGLFEQGKLAEAIAEFREALRLKPEFVDAHLNLGTALREQGKLEEAIAEYRKALRLMPDNASAHGNLGACLRDQGKLAEAIAECREAVRLRPDLAYAHHSLAYALVAQGKFDEAIDEERESLRIEPDNHDAQSGLGAALLKQGKLDEGIAAIHIALRLRPDSAGIHCNLGFGLTLQGKPDEAIAEYRTALRLDPEFTMAHHGLGKALLKQGKPDEAIAEYRTALRQKPEFPGAHHDLGNALRAHGELDAAVSAYREALRLKPDDAAAHTNLGCALLDQGRVDDAIAEHETAIRCQPENAIFHNNLGVALKKKGSLIQAETEFREAVRLGPELAVCHRSLGRTLTERGKLAEAESEYRTAIRLEPESPDHHSELGAFLCDDKHEYDGAIAEFRIAIRLKPNVPVYHCNLANACNGKQSYAAAVTEYTEALRLDPGDADAHHGLGNALGNQGKTDMAISEFREALRLKPDLGKAHFSLGVGLRQKAEFREALASLQRARQLGYKHSHPESAARLLHETEGMAMLERKLPAILSGQAKPADAAETLGFARLCYDKKLHTASARFWSEAFQAQPKLADDMQVQNRYNAACAAALAGCGQGKDDPPLDDTAKSRWRNQAIELLKADLAAWSKILESGAPQARQAISQTLQHWKADTDLAGIREPAALAKLPADEQTVCRNLWSQVEALVTKARGSASN